MRFVLLVLIALLMQNLLVARARAQSLPDVDQMAEDMLEEMNLVRANPSQYAQDFLQPMLSRFEGKRYFPDRQNWPTYFQTTKEGAAAVQDAIDALSATQPVGSLTASPSLYTSALKFAEERAEYIDTHVPSDMPWLQRCLLKPFADAHLNNFGQSYKYRMDAVATVTGWSGENLICNSSTTGVRKTILMYLIDDGVLSRGHRINILRPEFKVVGSACALNPTLNPDTKICVQDFATKAEPR